MTATAMDTKQDNQTLDMDFARLASKCDMVLESLDGDISHWISMYSPMTHSDEDDTRVQT